MEIKDLKNIWMGLDPHDVYKFMWKDNNGNTEHNSLQDWIDDEGVSESEVKEWQNDYFETLRSQLSQSELEDVVLKFKIFLKTPTRSWGDVWTESLQLDKNSQASDVMGELDSIEKNSKDLNSRNKAKRLKNKFKNKKVGDKLSNAERKEAESVLFKGGSSLNTTMNESKETIHVFTKNDIGTDKGLVKIRDTEGEYINYKGQRVKINLESLFLKMKETFPNLRKINKEPIVGWVNSDKASEGDKVVSFNESKSKVRQFIANISNNDFKAGKEDLEEIVKSKIEARYEKALEEQSQEED